ncbi:hypothetical protein INN71_13820 [Nocardioides sp. ChNu-153]|uniref:STAS domain-containing protein n=1 Tax=Nocardioides sp. ChNu-153 TaxID=2779364 RepID=UPI00264E0085|nr:hypothetical protein [Nocardioides sp. ChNu-153]MDN7122465.1 hypothetical protein [Nocardioides sp. ChNu-153]
MMAKNDDFEIRLEPDGSVLHVRGVVDQLSGPDLREFLEARVGGSGPLTVDLADVDILLAAGLRELDAGVRSVRERGALVDVRAPEGTMAHRVLDVARRLSTQTAPGYTTGRATGLVEA